MTREFLTAALLATAFSGQANAQAGLIDAGRPERIVEIARGFGTAELEKDKTGDPKISGRMDGTRYVIFFYGCKGGKSCKSIQFFASFESKKQLGLLDLNEFNRSNRFTKVYLDKDNDPALELDMNLDGGVSKKNIDDTFDWWKTVLLNFVKTFKE